MAVWTRATKAGLVELLLRERWVRVVAELSGESLSLTGDAAAAEHLNDFPFGVSRRRRVLRNLGHDEFARLGLERDRGRGCPPGLGGFRKLLGDGSAIMIMDPNGIANAANMTSLAETAPSVDEGADHLCVVGP